MKGRNRLTQHLVKTHLLCPNQCNYIHVIQPRHIQRSILLHVKPPSCQTGTICPGLTLYNDFNV